jgi:hypothetical protein
LLKTSIRVRHLADELRSGAWLNRRRVVAYAGILLALELITTLFVVAGTYGWIVKLDRPLTTDFVSFYAAGTLADSGTAAAAYIQPLHLAAEEQATAPGINYVFFFYPPVFLLLCAALARLPYLAAFALFELGTLVPFAMAIRRIVTQRAFTILPVLAFPAVLSNIGFGQNAFLTASLFAGATLLVDKRPVVAGLLFGALVYKPHFGLLVPLALVAGGNWRAFGAAAVSALTLVLLSALLFGVESWQGFLAAFAGSHQTYEAGKVDFAAFISPWGAMRLIGLSPGAAYLVQATATIAAAGAVVRAWRGRASLPVRAATLIAGTLVALPLALYYDMVLAMVAAAWLTRAALVGGFKPWEKTILALLFVAPLMTRGIGTALHIPLGFLAVLILLVLCIKRLDNDRYSGAPRDSKSYLSALPEFNTNTAHA